MSLPLKYKLAIRSRWEKPDAPTQTAIKNLEESIGYALICTPEWPLLISALGSRYDDEADALVGVVSGTVQAFCEQLAQIIDDPMKEAWTDKLWEELKQGSNRLNLFVQISLDQNSQMAQTTWNNERHGFVLYIPATRVLSSHHFTALLQDDLAAAFDEKKPSPEPVTSKTSRDTTAQSVPSRSRVPSEFTSTLPGGSTALPDVEALPRLDDILSRPPYHLIVRAMGDSRVDIECSHSPTLEVLSQYLKRWTRTNNNLSDKPPGVALTLRPSSFGLGLMHDVLTLEAEPRGPWHVSPTMLLHLAESVLGYDRVHTDTNSWQFRRDVPFRKA